MIPLFKVHMTKDVDEELLSVLHSGYVGEGEKVLQFENEVAKYLSTENVLTCNSGTSALHLAYHIASSPDSPRNGKLDGEIISTPITCTATNTPILANGLRLVWADCDPVTGNIDPEDIERKITSKTKAIVMVHWGGNPCEIDKINEIARRYGILTVEDGAHAMGMEYRGQKIGNHSDFTMLSLQAIKHVTSVDGGILITKNKEHYNRAKLLRWYGIDRTIREGIDLRCELNVTEYGYKFHMNDVCATIGLANLKYVDTILSKHRENARFYDDVFVSAPNVMITPENKHGKSSYWLYTLHVSNRDELMKELSKKGIMASKVHARNDTHTMFKNSRAILPNAESFNNTHLCIPVGWWVSPDEREYIAEAVLCHARL